MRSELRFTLASFTLLAPLAFACAGAPAKGPPVAAGASSTAPSTSASTSASASASTRAAPAIGEHGLAVCLLIDRSGSMSGLRMEMARKAAVAATEELHDDELIEVVAFDSSAETVIPLRAARNRAANRADIAGIQPAGGTDYLPGLVTAARDLDAVTDRHRHVVLVTDGLAPTEGVIERVRAMRARGITTSTIGLGGEADPKFLGLIAIEGEGREYLIDDPMDLPVVLRSEIRRARP